MAVPFDVTGTATVMDKKCKFFGYSIKENAGTPAPATVEITDGATGGVLAEIELGADGFDWAWFGPNGIDCRNGVTVTVSAGTVKGSVFVL